MRGLGLERPPRWGIALLIALVVGNVALFSFLALRSEPADPLAGRPSPAADEAVLADVPPSATEVVPITPEAEPSTPPVLAVYGDGYATGNQLGGQGAAGWPALVAQRVGAELRLNAVSQAGYAAEGVTGQNYLDLVQASPVPDADVTILFGSRNDDDETAGEVAQNAAAVLAAVRAAAPDTTVIVIGPVWSNSTPSAGVLAANDAVEEAAEAAGVTYVDALEGGWFATGEGIAYDGISPTDAGNDYLASAVLPFLQEALEAGAQGG
ncbi:GDSL-type esterase/lipase family protein [Modestobacter sp. SYSU DS0657]